MQDIRTVVNEDQRELVAGDRIDALGDIKRRFDPDLVGIEGTSNATDRECDRIRVIGASPTALRLSLSDESISGVLAKADSKLTEIDL